MNYPETEGRWNRYVLEGREDEAMAVDKNRK